MPKKLCLIWLQLMKSADEQIISFNLELSICMCHKAQRSRQQSASLIDAKKYT